MNKLQIYLNLSNKMKIFVFKAYFYTAFYRFRILYTPFSNLAKSMGKLGEESNEEVYDNVELLWQIQKSVKMVSKNTPWESLCLVQALTAQRLLSKKCVSNTVYLGVARDDEAGMSAHAWIRVGDKILLGGEMKDKYSVIAKFGSLYE